MKGGADTPVREKPELCTPSATGKFIVPVSSGTGRLASRIPSLLEDRSRNHRSATRRRSQISPLLVRSGDGGDAAFQIGCCRMVTECDRDGKNLARRRNSPQKTLGTLFASPSLPLLQVLNASCCFSSWLSFWLPWIYSPFPFFMESCNGRLLQLIECIESTQNEVKRKMIATGASNDAPKSLLDVTREEKSFATDERRSSCSSKA